MDKAAKPGLGSKHIAVAAAAFGVLIIAAIAFAFRSSSGNAPPPHTPLGRLASAWRDAGLEPGGFAAVDGAALGGGDCSAGAVSGILVTLCEHPDARTATRARRKAKSAVQRVRGSAAVLQKLVLIVADERGADPSGKRAAAILEVFRSELAAADKSPLE